MLYRFHSKAGADVLMTGPHGDLLLKHLGREPVPQGIFTVEQLPGLIATLEEAIARDDAARQHADDDETAGTESEPHEPQMRDAVTLRQRAWPLLDLMRHAQAGGHPLTWGG